MTETPRTTAERVGYSLEEIVIFGSRARGDDRPESDVVGVRGDGGRR